MRSIIVCAAILGLLCGVSLGAETREAEVLRLLQALEKAGLKVQPSEKTAMIEAEAESPEDVAACQELLKKLEAPEISVEYKDAKLGDILAELQKASGVNLVLDYSKVYRERRRDHDIEHVNLKLDKVKPISVLDNVLRMFDLTAVYSGEALMITVPLTEEPITLVYDVHELTTVHGFTYNSDRLMHGRRIPTPWAYRSLYYDDQWTKDEQKDDETQKPAYKADLLIKLLKASTPNGQWPNARDEENDGEPRVERYAITYADGVLVITQKPSVQIEIGNILLALKTRLAQ